MANQKLSHPDLKIPVFVHRVIEALYANPLTFSEQVGLVPPCESAHVGLHGMIF